MDKNSLHSSEDKFSDQIIPWEGRRNPPALSIFNVRLGITYLAETINFLLKM